MVALEAAQETGLPPKVVPWAPDGHCSMISFRATTAESGNPEAIPLATVSNVGNDPRQFRREPTTRPAHSRLDLVKNKKYTVTVANLAKCRQEGGWRREIATFTEKRLNDNGSNLFSGNFVFQCLFQILETAETTGIRLLPKRTTETVGIRYLVDGRKKRMVVPAVSRRTGSNGQRAKGPAMKGVSKGNYPLPAGTHSGQLSRPLPQPLHRNC